MYKQYRWFPVDPSKKVYEASCLQFFLSYCFITIKYIRMPFICRSINRLSSHNQELQRVKREQASFIDEESSILSIQEPNGSDNREGIQGRWTEQENCRFVLFVQYYQDIFASRHKRKVCKIFRTFSEYLTQRTAAQCRSHYQKMILKHKSIARLKKHYKSMRGDKVYNEQYELFKSQWQKTHPKTSKTSTEIKEFKEISIQTDLIIQKEMCTQCQRNSIIQEEEIQNNPVSSPFIYWNDPQQMIGGNNFGYFYWIPQVNNLENFI